MGLVVVALAGNAVEHVVGVQQAWKGRTDLAISLIQNSSLQVAIALLPLMVLASLFVSPVPMTLVLSPDAAGRADAQRGPRGVRRVRRRVDLARGPDAAGPVPDHRGLGLVRAAADAVGRTTLGLDGPPRRRARGHARGAGGDRRRAGPGDRGAEIRLGRGHARHGHRRPRVARRPRRPGATRPPAARPRGGRRADRLGQPRGAQPRVPTARGPARRGLRRRVVLRAAPDDPASAGRRPRVRRHRLPAGRRGADLRGARGAPRAGRLGRSRTARRPGCAARASASASARRR